MTVEIRDCNEEEDGRDWGFSCEAKAGIVSLLRVPPIKDGRPGSPTEGQMLDLSMLMGDLIAEYDGCYTPGQALAEFGRALDIALSLEGWRTRGAPEPKPKGDPQEF